MAGDQSYPTGEHTSTTQALPVAGTLPPLPLLGPAKRRTPRGTATAGAARSGWLGPLAALAALGPLLFAPGCAGARAPAGGLVRLGVDNDSAAGRDEGYTSGLQLGWVDRGGAAHRDGPFGRNLGELLDLLPGVGEPGRKRHQSLSIAHRMYTPARLNAVQPVEGDVPYSAQLTATWAAFGQGPDELDALAFTGGVLGPAALGRELQELVHKTVTGEQARGWRNQLENEPLVQLAYEHRRRIARAGSRDAMGGDVLVLGGAGIGNHLTHGTLGLALRLGWRVPDDLAMQPPYFGEDLLGSLPWTRASRGQSLYGILGADAAWIGYHAPWDGNLWRSGPSVDYDPYLTRLTFGAVWRGGRWRFEAAGVWANVPFENELGRTTQIYGRLALGYAP